MTRRNKIDPRQQRTQEALLGALDELLAEKPFSEISVSDLARRAGIGRQTFYRHFDSIGAMLEKRLGTVLLGQIEWACAHADNLSARELAFRIHLFAFEHVETLPHIAHAMLSGAAGQNALSSFMEQIIAMREALPKPPGTNVPPEAQDFIACYHAGSIVSVLLKWVEAGCTPDAVTMARFMAQMSNKPCGDESACQC